jgi:hypothetical protein
VSEGKKESGSFLKKRTKKLLSMGASMGGDRTRTRDQPGGGPSMAFCTKPMPRMT